MLSSRQQRMPVSCENCRKRKIRCLGGCTPCQTCIRRGLSSTCHFLKNQPSRSPQARQASHEEVPTSSISQIGILEGLLRENISLTKRALNSQPQTFSEATPTSSADSESQSIRTSLPKPGRLIRSATGHVRYVATHSVFPDLTQDSPYVDLPFCGGSNTTHQELLDLLPPLSCCDELKDVFMDVFSPLFHVLHDPTFETEYAMFRHSPHEASLTFLALVFTILAIGVTALETSHQLLADLGRQANAGANARSIAARFRNAAMRALVADQFLWRHNLQTLQALILLIYALSHAHGPAWSLIGTTLNIAIAIGCHIDPSRYDVARVEAEERRRCWAALLMLYTIQETSLGIQAPIIIQADTRPPADIDDDDLLLVASGNDTEDIPTQFPSKMAYILHKFKLYRLAAEICSSTNSEALNNADIVRLDHMIATEEAKQEQQFAHLEDLPTYHQAHYLILNSYTNHLYLILHSHTLTKSCTSETPARARSIRRLTDASFSIWSNYETLRLTAKFQRYRWYTDGLGSFHAFLAASAMAAICSSPHGGDLDQQSKSQVVLSLRRCLEHLRSAASRSDICARAAEVLSHLLKSPPSQELRPCDASLSTISSHTGGSSGTESFATSTAQCPETFPSRLLGSVSNGESHSNPDHGSYQPSTFVDVDIDLDGWTTGAELQNFFDQIPNQQWLSPSVFPWTKWNNDEYLRHAHEFQA